MSPARWQYASRYQCPSMVTTCTGSTVRVVSSSREPEWYSISIARPWSTASRTAARCSGVSTSSPTASREPSAASSLARARRSASSSDPGTARSSRADAATAKPSAGVRRRGRAYSGGRNARTECSDTSISISVSGV